MENMVYDVAIIGAGLSGLTSAALMNKAGRKVVVLEAGSYIGGRIRSLTNDSGDFIGDLGPSWVWPSMQPIAKQWIEFLNCNLSEQYEAGDGILDLNKDSAVTPTPIQGQPGISRVKGGAGALVSELLKTVSDEQIQLESQVLSIRDEEGVFCLNIGSETQPHVYAKRIICSVPPRNAVESINWNNLLPVELKKQLENTPTWMATQAKVLVTYEQAFWRKNGLSGRVASHVGPLVEIHDHCSENEATAALFGFMGLSHQQRVDYKGGLPGLIMKQLIRCFGSEAASATRVEIHDWAENSNICSALDKETPAQHPQIANEIVRKPHYDNRIFFGASETAAQSPGLIEGAFVAGTWAARGVISAIAVEEGLQKAPH